MISRREFLGTSLGAGATLALTPELLLGAFQQSGKLIQRGIPSSGETVPIVSFGARQTDPATMKALLKTLIDNGGRVVDVLHGGPAGEDTARMAASELGVQDKLFWTTPLTIMPPFQPGAPPPKPDAAATKAGLEQKFATFKVPRIDVVMISRIRYIWVQSCCVNPTWAAPRGNATYGNFGGAHVFRSIDNGETWHNLDGSGSNGLPDVALADSHAGWTETVTRVYAWPWRVARHSSVKFANGVNPTRSCQRARVSSHARGGRGHRLWTGGDADRAERREPSDGW